MTFLSYSCTSTMECNLAVSRKIEKMALLHISNPKKSAFIGLTTEMLRLYFFYYTTSILNVQDTTMLFSSVDLFSVNSPSGVSIEFIDIVLFVENILSITANACVREQIFELQVFESSRIKSCRF